jgi:hypothetical protein
MTKAVGARDLSGDVDWHASCDPGAGYHTLCGTSLNDTEFEPVDPPAGQKITCIACKRVWLTAKTFRANDFT